MDTNKARIDIVTDKDFQQKVKKAAKANRMTIAAYCQTMIEIGMQTVEADKTKASLVARHLVNTELIG